MSQKDTKALSRGVSRDMSPQAIARRLKIVDELHELAKALGSSQRLGKVEQAGKDLPGNTINATGG